MTMMYGKGSKPGAFKPCKGCPSPAKCKAKGACAMAAKPKK
jgi:hypothetical protein